jgi:hypothetical protein
MSNECNHGQLARSCNICEYENTITELEQELEAAKTLLAALWENRKDEHWCFEMAACIECF